MSLAVFSWPVNLPLEMTRVLSAIWMNPVVEYLLMPM